MKMQKQFYLAQKSESRRLSLFSFINSKRQGITLVEILLVVGIFAIVAAVIFPSLSQFFIQSQYEGTVRELGKFIDYGRSRAYMEDNFLRMQIDLKENVYFLEILDEEESNDFEPFQGKFGRGRKLPKDVQFTSPTSSQIIFLPDGAAEKYSISISRKDTRKATIKPIGYFGKPEIIFQ